MQPEDIPADASTLIRIGTIASIDLARARCTVRYGNPDEDGGGAETPPIRWLTGRAGKTRIWSPPSIGEQVLLFAPDGQFAAGIAVTGIVQDRFPPAGADETEVIEFADGARIVYDPNAHALFAKLPDGGMAAIEAPAGLRITGPVTIEGDVSITGTAKATEDVIAGGVSVKNHIHDKVQAGGGVSGKPVAPG